MARKNHSRPRSPRASVPRIEAERRRLQRASAVLTGAALAAEHDVDGDVVADAVVAGRELIDAAIAALDSTNLSTNGGSDHG